MKRSRMFCPSLASSCPVVPVKPVKPVKPFKPFEAVWSVWCHQWTMYLRVYLETQEENLPDVRCTRALWAALAWFNSAAPYLSGASQTCQSTNRVPSSALKMHCCLLVWPPAVNALC